MAMKKFCDRCGAEIKPMTEVAYAGISRYKYEGKLPYELCPECADKLRKWLSGKGR